MDTEEISALEDLMANFDPETFLTSDNGISKQFRTGMKAHSEDPMTFNISSSCSAEGTRWGFPEVYPATRLYQLNSTMFAQNHKNWQLCNPSYCVNVPDFLSKFMACSPAPWTCSFNEESSFLPTETIPDNPTPYQLNIPSTAEMVGSYNFHVELGNQSKRVANPEWVYKNNKLYIKAGTLCPIIFSASSTLPQPSHIRIMPVFKNPEDIRDIVRCCPNHTMDNVDKTSFSSVKHFVRCENEQTSYKECPLTGRYYLGIPFIPSQRDPHSKTVTTHELLSFVCNNSCVGLNRRPIQVIFEMIHGQSIMGRGILEVRVCACPGRDSNLEDKQQKQPFRRKRRLQSTDDNTGLADRLYMHVEEPPFLAPATIPTAGESNETPPKKKKQTGENFYLKINGRQNYVIMERIAKALELFSSMEKRFFSKNFPFQVLEQMQRRSQNECPEYTEADTTMYRCNPCQENTQFSSHATSLSPSSSIPQWADSTQLHNQAAASTSQNMQISYSNHTVRRTSLVS